MDKSESKSFLKARKKIGDFQIGKILGSGTFGKVHEGIHLPTGERVAIKVLEKLKITNISDLERIKQELQILMKVDHPNIIKLLQFHETEKHLYIITELIQGEELFDKIVAHEKLQTDECGLYLCQIIDAVEYLHSRRICHRDIKPQNIIVQKNNSGTLIGSHQLKIIDFGLSKEFGIDKILCTSCGSPCYAAPEMLKSSKNRKYDAIKTDIWAIGVTLHAMAIGRLPFQDDNTERLYERIFQGKYTYTEAELKQTDESIKRVIKDMLIVDPEKRISLEELNKKYNNWLSKYKNKLESFAEFIKNQKDSLIIESISQFFKLPIEKVHNIIKTKQIQSIATYYCLCWQRTLKKAIQTKYINHQEAQVTDYEYHQGGFHINFVFDSFKALETFVQQHPSTCNGSASDKIDIMTIVDKKSIAYRGVIIPIKKLQGSDLLYIDFPSYFTMNS